MKIQIITLFPDMFTAVLGTSMLWKAGDRGIVEYSMIDLREYGSGPRRQVDDTPYGGGDGMLLMVEPLQRAIEHPEVTSTSSPRPRRCLLATTV
jgi:tRNA (guanine37-N1)-methyltransferase